MSTITFNNVPFIGKNDDDFQFVEGALVWRGRPVVFMVGNAVFIQDVAIIPMPTLAEILDQGNIGTDAREALRKKLNPPDSGGG